MLDLRQQMHTYRYPADEPIDPETLFSGQDEIELPFGKDAFLVYSAYQNGYLPRAGGILDQPRAFKQLLNIMNTLYAAADEHELFMVEIDPTALIVDDAPRSSFEDFMKRG